ncbi:MAG: AraC family transcriptional regulator [Deltaproteobacteria bacterium]|nr:AraC family transcriptional regulator [Deltaproteobacteria bacterium]
MNNDLLDVAGRLLRALETPIERRILGNGAVNEILYYIFTIQSGIQTAARTASKPGC